VKNPFSSATHSCRRTCGWMRNLAIGYLLVCCGVRHAITR
jgi:hypothetical protein